MDGKDRFISIKGSPMSFHTKCSDALKWLMIYQDEEHTDLLGNLHTKGSYAALRGQIKFKAMEDKNDHSQLKIRIAFLKNELIANEIIAQEIVPLTDQEKVREIQATVNLDPNAWKGKLIKEFVEEPTYKVSGKIYELKGLQLTLTDQAWVSNLLEQIPQCTFDIEPNRIIAMIRPLVNT